MKLFCNLKSGFSIFITVIFFMMIITANAKAQNFNIHVFWNENTDAGTIKFSSDGNTLFTGGATINCYPATCGKISRWNINDSSLLNSITNFLLGQVNEIALSSDNSKFISGNGGIYCPGESGCYIDRPGLYNFNTNGTLNTSATPAGNVYSLAYSPGETVIAAGTGYNNTGVISIYDNSFNLLRTLAGHGLSTNSVAFTPDEKYLISGGSDGFVKFWDYKTGTLVRSLYHGDYLNEGTNINVAVSADGKYAASTGIGYSLTVKIWRIADGKLIATLPLNIGTTGGWAKVAFTPDNKYIAAATVQYKSRGGYYGRILFWDLRTGKLANIYEDKEGGPVAGGIKSIAFSPNSKQMAYGLNNNTFKVATIDYGNTFAANSIADEPAENKKQHTKTLAYPNPFASTTTISFTLQKAAMVSIKLYNAQGEEVAIILNEKRNAGTQTLLFNGRQIPAGIYFYKIHTESFDSVNKLIKY